VKLLQKKELDYSVVDFSAEQLEILSEIKKAHDWPTVPMVFSRTGQDIKFIGGYTDLLESLKNE
jgi:glutaredoxin-related protein